MPCGRPPCYAPCKKTLKCGHPCIGFCGEICPPLCRECDKEEVTRVQLGYEDDEDSRFVYLEDCKHTVESHGLEHWLQSSQDQIKMPVCPLCNCVITSCARFSKIMRPQYAAVCKVKTKVFGARDRIEKSRNKHVARLRSIPKEIITEVIPPQYNLHQFRSKQAMRKKVIRKIEFTKLLVDCDSFIKIYNILLAFLDAHQSKGKKRNFFSDKDMETLGIKCDILHEIAKRSKKIEDYVVVDTARAKLLKQMCMILHVIDSRNE